MDRSRTMLNHTSIALPQSHPLILHFVDPSLAAISQRASSRAPRRGRKGAVGGCPVATSVTEHRRLELAAQFTGRNCFRQRCERRGPRSYDAASRRLPGPLRCHRNRGCALRSHKAHGPIRAPFHFVSPRPRNWLESSRAGKPSAEPGGHADARGAVPSRRGNTIDTRRPGALSASAMEAP